MGKMDMIVKFTGVLKPIKHRNSQELAAKFHKNMNSRPHSGRDP